MLYFYVYVYIRHACVCVFMTHACMFICMVEGTYWAPLSICGRHDSLQSAVMKSRLTSMCNYGLHITCRDGTWRSRSKVSPVYAKRLSFYNTCVQRQGQQPLHHSLSEHDPPSRELNPGPMFVQYFMCAAFHLLNTQWITLCLKSYFELRHNLSLNQYFLYGLHFMVDLFFFNNAMRDNCIHLLWLFKL